MKVRMSFLVLLIVVMFSCAREDIENLQREDLFSLEFGKMEDQINIVQAPGEPFDTGTQIMMKNGFFYISNHTQEKLMKFNSYGDIVELYYNSEKNPEPVLLKRVTGEGNLSTKRAFEYPFADIRNFAVSSTDCLYVDDRIPEVRREYDEEIGALLDRIILRFDENGHLLDYLGQEGIGGTPFSYIEKIDINLRDEIVVTTRNTKSWRCFWFTSDGRPVVTVDVPLSSLPVPEDTDYIPSLENVFPDNRARTLYLKVDYYGSIKGPEGESGFGYVSSAVLVLDAETGRYFDTIDIPVLYRESSQPAGFTETDQKMVYEFLGVARGRFFFLMSPEEGAYYRLMVIDRTGRVIKRTRIELADGSLCFRDMHVDPDGILSALLCLENGIEVVWWRSDKLITGAEE